MVTVTYTCPRCGAVVELERDAYLADKAVTPDPLDGWTYAHAYEDYERDEVEGVKLVCGATETRSDGCGELFYLSFVRHEDGEEVDPRVPLASANFEFLGG